MTKGIGNRRPSSASQTGANNTPLGKRRASASDHGQDDDNGGPTPPHVHPSRKAQQQAPKPSLASRIGPVVQHAVQHNQQQQFERWQKKQREGYQHHQQYYQQQQHQQQQHHYQQQQQQQQHSQHQQHQPRPAPPNRGHSSPQQPQPQTSGSLLDKYYDEQNAARAAAAQTAAGAHMPVHTPPAPQHTAAPAASLAQPAQNGAHTVHPGRAAIVAQANAAAAAVAHGVNYSTKMNAGGFANHSLRNNQANANGSHAQHAAPQAPKDPDAMDVDEW